MIYKGPNGIGIAKIHSQSDARIHQHVVLVIRNVHGIAQKRFTRGPAEVIEQQKVKLMNVELFATLVMVKPWLVSHAETFARSLALSPKRAPNCSDVSH